MDRGFVFRLVNMYLENFNPADGKVCRISLWKLLVATKISYLTVSDMIVIICLLFIYHCRCCMSLNLTFSESSAVTSTTFN